MELQLPAHVPQQDLHVKLERHHITVCVGQKRVISGTLAGQIQPRHSSWQLGELLLFRRGLVLPLV